MKQGVGEMQKVNTEVEAGQPLRAAKLRWRQQGMSFFGSVKKAKFLLQKKRRIYKKRSRLGTNNGVASS